ncbi:hypothetical protein ACFXPZ_40635 [Streptomyces sp. NPDC059101]|uniref:hypothetical protein n=1 Tax=Streptomyces sp. NPDC059101 TaxID=3346728 RepID=UPI0036B00F68
MRVLYLLNISNPDRLSADSGWIFADLLAPALADAGAVVTVAAPAAAGDARCGFHQTKVPGTKYRARFSADIDELVALIRAEKPDAVVANQIEEAPAIRTALLEAGSDALLAGYCHYLPFSFSGGGQLLLDPSLNDVGLGRPVLLAFAAGLAACDRVMVHSSTAASWVSAVAARTTVDLGDRLRVVPAPRDERLVRDPVAVHRRQSAAAIGVYNHSTGPSSSCTWPAIWWPPARIISGSWICSAGAGRLVRDWTAAPSGCATSSPPCHTSKSSPTGATASATGICWSTPASASLRSGPAARGP